MAPVANRLTISTAGSTSSIGTGVRPSSSRRADAEHAAHGHQLLGLVVDLLGERAVLVGQVAAHGVLQVGDDAGRHTCASPRTR